MYKSPSFFIEFLNSLNFLNSFIQQKKLVIKICFSDILPRNKCSRNILLRNSIFKNFKTFLLFRLYLELYYLKTFLQSLIMLLYIYFKIFRKKHTPSILQIEMANCRERFRQCSHFLLKEAGRIYQKRCLLLRKKAKRFGHFSHSFFY